MSFLEIKMSMHWIVITFAIGCSSNTTIIVQQQDGADISLDDIATRILADMGSPPVINDLSQSPIVTDLGVTDFAMAPLDMSPLRIDMGVVASPDMAMATCGVVGKPCCADEIAMSISPSAAVICNDGSRCMFQTDACNGTAPSLCVIVTTTDPRSCGGYHSPCCTAAGEITFIGGYCGGSTRCGVGGFAGCGGDCSQ